MFCVLSVFVSCGASRVAPKLVVTSSRPPTPAEIKAIEAADAADEKEAASEYNEFYDIANRRQLTIARGMMRSAEGKYDLRLKAIMHWVGVFEALKKQSIPSGLRDSIDEFLQSILRPHLILIKTYDTAVVEFGGSFEVTLEAWQNDRRSFSTEASHKLLFEKLNKDMHRVVTLNRRIKTVTTLYVKALSEVVDSTCAWARTKRLQFDYCPEK